MNNSVCTFSNLDEIELFLENLKLTKLTDTEIDNLNSLTVVKEMGSLLKTSEYKIPQPK